MAGACLRSRSPEAGADSGDANAEYQEYLRYYNDERPHRGLDMMTPNEFHATLQDAARKSELC